MRREDPRDIDAVRAVNLAAFGQPDEAGVVDALRRNCAGLLSFVAVEERRIVGVIFREEFDRAV